MTGETTVPETTLPETTVPTLPATEPFGTDCTALIAKGDVGTCVVATGTDGTIAAVAEHPEQPASDHSGLPPFGARPAEPTTTSTSTTPSSTTGDDETTSTAPGHTTGCLTSDTSGELTPPGASGTETTTTSTSTTSTSTTTVAGGGTTAGRAATTVEQTDLVYLRVGDLWKLALERKLTEPVRATTQVYCSELLGSDDPVAVFVVPAADGLFGNQLDMITDTGQVTLTYKLGGGFAVAHPAGSPAHVDLYVPKAGGHVFARLSLESTPATADSPPAWKVTSNTGVIGEIVARRLSLGRPWAELRPTVAPTTPPVPTT